MGLSALAASALSVLAASALSVAASDFSVVAPSSLAFFFSYLSKTSLTGLSDTAAMSSAYLATFYLAFSYLIFSQWTSFGYGGSFLLTSSFQIWPGSSRLWVLCISSTAAP